jgi:hypothetical protein
VTGGEQVGEMPASVTHGRRTCQVNRQTTPVLAPEKGLNIITLLPWMANMLAYTAVCCQVQKRR